MIKRFLQSATLAVVLLMLLALPVLAISNPDEISFSCTDSAPVYKAFYNVLEEDDMIFIAEQFIDYTTTPNETASDAFLFELLNVAGNETIASAGINAYGAKPVSIYMTAAQVAAEGLSVNSSYILRLTGNPLLFSSSTNNSVIATLGLGDYVDQELGDDDGVASDNNMRNFLIGVAEDLEIADNTTYITTVSNVKYVNSAGGSIFMMGIPSIESMCPIMFQYSSTVLPEDEPDSTGAYESGLSPLAKWGDTVSQGLTNLGDYIGVSQEIAGSLVLFVIVMALAVFAYMKTQSGIAVLLLVGGTPFLGAFFGLMPIALAFVFTIVIVVLMGFFFFSRGAL